MKTALIIGASGQTGAYLARLLLETGYSVTGTSRNWAESQTWRLNRLGVLDDVKKISLSLHDSLALEEALDSEAPEEIYYLAGPSSVAASFREPTTSMSEIFDPVVSLLEILKRRSSTAHFVNAASTDCFGNHGTSLLDERSPMKPVSPYGIAKTATYLTTQNYREAFGVDSRNAILTNHESPLRGPDFVTQKIISGLRAISDGLQSTLALGNTTIARDWLWADDVAQALHSIGSSIKSSDYVVASGTTSTLDAFTEIACAEFGLEAREVITHEPGLSRPLEIQSVRLNPAKVQQDHGWKPSVSFQEIVERLISREV